MANVRVAYKGVVKWVTVPTDIAPFAVRARRAANNGLSLLYPKHDCTLMEISAGLYAVMQGAKYRGNIIVRSV